MPVFRVEKTNNFTVMSNHHLRNINLSLKAKGLLSMILSLPNEWDFTLKGLAVINKEGIDAVRVAINELEKEGYIKRNRVRNDRGQLVDTEYIIYEQPMLENPILDNPILDNPMLEKPTLENPTQLNKDILNTNISNKDFINNPSINQRENDGLMELYQKTVSEVKEQVDYETLIHTHDIELVDNIVNVMVDVMLLGNDYYKIEGKSVPTELVRERYKQITYGSIETLLLGLSDIYYKISNPKAYLITALYNAPLTVVAAMSNRVKSDMYGKGVD